MAAVKLLCLVIVAVVVAAAPAAVEALTCGQVASGIGPCLGYLRKTGGPTPSATCCKGIKGLSSAANTAADRKTACQCLQSAASSIKGIDLGLAAGLPGKCGVSVPYKISPSTNCNNVK